MQLKDTVRYMSSTDYKERFLAEYFQLQIRVEGLTRMLEKWEDGVLEFTPTTPKAIFISQLDVMTKYLEILRKRAEIEGINLEKKPLEIKLVEDHGPCTFRAYEITPSKFTTLNDVLDFVRSKASTGDLALKFKDTGSIALIGFESSTYIEYALRKHHVTDDFNNIHVDEVNLCQINEEANRANIHLVISEFDDEI